MYTAFTQARGKQKKKSKLVESRLWEDEKTHQGSAWLLHAIVPQGGRDLSYWSEAGNQHSKASKVWFPARPAAEDLEKGSLFIWTFLSKCTEQASLDNEKTDPDTSGCELIILMSECSPAAWLAVL